MSEQQNKGLTILVSLLEGATMNRLTFDESVKQLQRRIGSAGLTELRARNVIEYALDNWLVEKQLDYADEQGEIKGDLVWFICLLSEKETEEYRSLPEESKCLLRILYECSNEGDRGVIRADVALETIRMQGHDIEVVPHICHKTDSFFMTSDGNFVEFCYLVPEHEKSDEYQAGLRDLDEMVRKNLYRDEERTLRKRKSRRREGSNL